MFMAISGSSYSTLSSSYLSTSDNNSLRQKEKNQNLNPLKNDIQNTETPEFILRGELLEDVEKFKGFDDKKEQTIDPANQTAIENYEINSQAKDDPLSTQQQGRILDAYA